MSKKLEGKIALVTGGSRGIGAAVAKRLAADGANVAITYAKDAKAASAVVKAIERAGQKAIAIQADAIDADAVAAAVEKTVVAFGRLDVLVNNAGTAIPKAFEETTLEEMDRVLNINVRGVFAATQAALKHMNEGGRIIMIGSAVGERAVAPGLVPYAATKGAVKMFTQALSREVGKRGITVNNIQPGPIDTDLNPASGDWAVPQKAATALDRYGHVEEIAAMAAFVAGLFDLIESIPPTLKYDAGTILAEGDFVIVHGRFSDFGAPVNWIAADIVRLEAGKLTEHWDVIQDEATKEQSKSGAPMFGATFPTYAEKRTSLNG